MIKLAMVKTAKKLKNLSIAEQGAGVFDMEEFFSAISSSQHAAIHPSKIDLRANASYYLPFSR